MTAKKMKFNYKALKAFDFIHLRSKNWGAIDCVVIKNSRKKITFLATEPYEDSDVMDFRYFTMIDKYEDLEGFFFKEVEDIFMLLGKTDDRILSMQYRILDNE
jgi:hypothetical protein